MDKNIQKLTQEERLDLTDEQVISEKEAYAKSLMVNIQTPYKEIEKIEEFSLKQVIDNQERVIKEQKEEIERLKAQLDRGIKINRKMKNALEVYANTEPIEIMQKRWDGEPTTLGKTMLDIRKPAQQVLKEIEKEE